MAAYMRNNKRIVTMFILVGIEIIFVGGQSNFKTPSAFRTFKITARYLLMPTRI